jgi:hypothetical protein
LRFSPVSFTATSKVPMKADCVLEPKDGAYRRGVRFSDQGVGARLAVGGGDDRDLLAGELAERLMEPRNVVPVPVLRVEVHEIRENQTAVHGVHLSDADAKAIFERGIAKGRAEQQESNLEFYDGDGRPRWYDMAVYCQRNAGRLRSQWEKDFIADIAGKVLGSVPSPKQARCILKIFIKLGGDCDPKIQAAYFQQ